MVLSSTSMTQTKRAAAHTRLSKLTAANEGLINVGADTLLDLTRSEDFLVLLGLTLIHLILVACNPDVQSKEDVRTATQRSCDRACVNLVKFKTYIEIHVQGAGDGKIPAFFTTLHPLYTAYEAGKMALAVADYLTNSDIWKHEGIAQLATRIRKDAKELQQSVRTIAARVRKGLNEGHWLDFVLDQVRTKDSDSGDSTAENDEAEDSLSADASIAKDASRKFDDKDNIILPPLEMGAVFTEALGSDFLEYWAGELVESWRESVMGLACLKSS